MTTTANQHEGKPFLAAVHAFCKLLYQIGDDRVKAATFVFENTICYWEFNTFKKITLDEFVRGRKLKNGERFTEGCGINDRANANRALLSLRDQGHLEIKTDAKDGGRRKRFYRLTLPSLDTVVTTDYREPDIVVTSDYNTAATQPITVVTTDYREPDIVVTSDYSVQSPVTTLGSHQRLHDQSKYSSKYSNPIPSTTVTKKTKANALHPVRLVEVEEDKEKKEEEDEEKRIAQQQTLLTKRILDARDHARTARKLGKYAGWTEDRWVYEERVAQQELDTLLGRGSA